MRRGSASYIGAAVHVAIGRNPRLLTSPTRLYLDHAATTPVLAQARGLLLPSVVLELILGILIGIALAGALSGSVVGARPAEITRPRLVQRIKAEMEENGKKIDELQRARHLRGELRVVEQVVHDVEPHRVRLNLGARRDLPIHLFRRRQPQLGVPGGTGTSARVPAATLEVWWVGSGPAMYSIPLPVAGRFHYVVPAHLAARALIGAFVVNRVGDFAMDRQHDAGAESDDRGQQDRKLSPGDRPKLGGVQAPAQRLRWIKAAVGKQVKLIPVSDVDRAKDFYKRMGFREDADFAFDNGFRVVQFTPPGSGCSVQFGTKMTSVLRMEWIDVSGWI